MIQNIIVILRFLTIFLLILGAIIAIIQRGEIANPNKITYYDFGYFSSLFGNVVFAFMMHHSIPGILKPVRPEKDVKKVVFYSYIFGCCLLFIVSITAVLAFGDLNNDCSVFPCKIAVSFYIF